MKKKLFFTLLIATIFSAASANALWVTSTADLNVRSVPMVDSSSHAVLWEGQSTKVIDSVYGWYKVEVEDEIGYVSAEYVTTSNTKPQEKKTTEKKKSSGLSGKAVKYTKCRFDRQTDYPDVSYTTSSGQPEGATIASGGCAPTTVGNILRNLCHIKAATTENVCRLAVSCGARYDGGTDAGVLLKAAKDKWGGFTYVHTKSDKKMIQHVRHGGMAVAKTYGASSGPQSLFSYSGHYVAIVSRRNYHQLVVMDPYYYSGKWTETGSRIRNITTTDTPGLVYAATGTVRKACCEYYLITPD